MSEGNSIAVFFLMHIVETDMPVWFQAWLAFEQSICSCAACTFKCACRTRVTEGEQLFVELVHCVQVPAGFHALHVSTGSGCT